MEWAFVNVSFSELHHERRLADYRARISNGAPESQSLSAALALLFVTVNGILNHMALRQQQSRRTLALQLV